MQYVPVARSTNVEPEKMVHPAKPNIIEKSSSIPPKQSAVQVIENRSRKVVQKSAASVEIAPKHVKPDDYTEMARKVSRNNKNNETFKAGNVMSEKDMIERIHRMRLDGNAAFPDIVACTR